MDERRRPGKEAAAPVSAVYEQQKAVLARLVVEQTRGVRELMPHQVDFVDRFIEYFETVMESREQGTEPNEPRMARIVAAPRTGKTAVAAEIMRRTGLKAVFLVPTRTLIDQASAELQKLLPDKKVAKYAGGRGNKDDLGDADVIVATYQISQSDRRVKGELPPELSGSPLVFADEGHEATSQGRAPMMREAFDPAAIRIALTGTPDYSEARKLEQYYPDLIHTITTPEAVELGLLSAYQYWVFKIDLDASKVEMRAGDYDQAQMARVMSGLPLFSLVEQIRYHKDNQNIPALICFRGKQQAEDAAAYLRRIRPAEASRIAVVTEDTKNRQEILQGYEDGVYDTLITVQVLTRGWDSGRCKMLIDCDPTTSPVRAGQKYTRPLTKTSQDDDRVAQIYAIAPRGLPFKPLLPSDVLAEADVECPPGKLGGKTYGHPKNIRRQILPLPDMVEGMAVTAVTSMADFGELRPLKIDRHNKILIQNIVKSGYTAVKDELSEEEWLVDILYSYREFQMTFFQNKDFTGYGRTLLWSLGIRNKKEFDEFVNEMFPEQKATMLLVSGRFSDNRMPYLGKRRKAVREEAGELPSAEEDAQTFFASALDKVDRAAMMNILRAVTGARADQAQADERTDPLLARFILKCVSELEPRAREMLIKYFVENMNLREIADEWGISREAVSQKFNKALRKIRKKVLEYLRRSPMFAQDKELIARLTGQTELEQTESGLPEIKPWITVIEHASKTRKEIKERDKIISGAIFQYLNKMDWESRFRDLVRKKARSIVGSLEEQTKEEIYKILMKGIDVSRYLEEHLKELLADAVKEIKEQKN